MMQQADSTVPNKDRLPLADWAALRTWLLENDPDAQRMLEWSESLRYRIDPISPANLATEVIWIILCAGRSAQAARTLEARVMAAILQGRPAVEAFGYKAKAAAIDRAWRERTQNHTALTALPANDPWALIEWCGSLPFVGAVTRYQLAKNLGADVVKPDIWLCRLAGIPDRARIQAPERFRICMAFAETLAQVTGDRIASIDSLLWLACNKGYLQVSPEAGPVTFHAGHPRTRSIFTAAPPA